MPARGARPLSWTIVVTLVAIVVTSILVIVLELQEGGPRWTDDRTIDVVDSGLVPRDVLWEPPVRLPEPVATEGDEYGPHVSRDGMLMFLVRGRAGENADILLSRRLPAVESAAPGRAGVDVALEVGAERWSTPVPLDAVNTDADELHPSLSPDGRWLWFASNREGGEGGYDLWRVARHADGSWGEPEGLGIHVNSPADEYGPAPAPDGASVWFASNRRAPGDPESEGRDGWSGTMRAGRDGRRDFDLYRLPLGDAGPGRPQRLAGLSTPADEGVPAISPAGDFVYFASDRAGGRGGFDLYRARLTDGAPAEVRPLDGINTAADELDPAPCLEGFGLVFASDRVTYPERLTSGGSVVPPPPIAGGAHEDLFRSVSREVYVRRDPVVATWDWGRILPILPWLMLLALLALLAYLLRRLQTSGRLRTIGLLTRCLLASALAHVIIGMLLGAWTVSGALADGYRDRGGGKAQLTAASGGAGLERQLFGAASEAMEADASAVLDAVFAAETPEAARAERLEAEAPMDAAARTASRDAAAVEPSMAATSLAPAPAPPTAEVPAASAPDIRATRAAAESIPEVAMPAASARRRLAEASASVATDLPAETPAASLDAVRPAVDTSVLAMPMVAAGAPAAPRDLPIPVAGERLASPADMQPAAAPAAMRADADAARIGDTAIAGADAATARNVSDLPIGTPDAGTPETLRAESDGRTTDHLASDLRPDAGATPAAPIASSPPSPDAVTAADGDPTTTTETMARAMPDPASTMAARADGADASTLEWSPDVADSVTDAASLADLAERTEAAPVASTIVDAVAAAPAPTTADPVAAAARTEEAPAAVDALADAARAAAPSVVTPVPLDAAVDAMPSPAATASVDATLELPDAAEVADTADSSAPAASGRLATSTAEALELDPIERTLNERSDTAARPMAIDLSTRPVDLAVAMDLPMPTAAASAPGDADDADADADADPSTPESEPRPVDERLLAAAAPVAIPGLRPPAPADDMSAVAPARDAEDLAIESAVESAADGGDTRQRLDADTAPPSASDLSFDLPATSLPSVDIPVATSDPTAALPMPVPLPLPAAAEPEAAAPAVPEPEPGDRFTRVIMGRVTDADTGRGVEGAEVRLDTEDDRTVVGRTDEGGWYVIVGPDGPDYVAITAVHPEYEPASENVRAARRDEAVVRRDFELMPERSDMIAIEEVPEVRHVGDDSFSGRVNSRFQRPSEGPSVTLEFEVDPEWLIAARDAGGTVRLVVLARGCQRDNPVEINGRRIRRGLSDSPSDGRFGEVRRSFRASMLRPGRNTITIRSAASGIGSDIDDFEFVNPRIERGDVDE